MVATAVRAQLARTTQTCVYLLAVVAMAFLLARHLSADGIMASGHHMHGATGMPQTTNALASPWLWWMVMTVAMMFPVAAAGAHRIAQASLWRDATSPSPNTSPDTYPSGPSWALSRSDWSRSCGRTVLRNRL